MLNIVLTIVFSIVMLMFMIFPAMKIVDFIEKIAPIKKYHDLMVVLMTIFLSILIGLFLKFG